MTHYENLTPNQQINKILRLRDIYNRYTPITNANINEQEDIDNQIRRYEVLEFIYDNPDIYEFVSNNRRLFSIITGSNNAIRQIYEDGFPIEIMTNSSLLNEFIATYNNNANTIINNSERDNNNKKNKQSKGGKYTRKIKRYIKIKKQTKSKKHSKYNK